jgi:hypothetical protein
VIHLPRNDVFRVFAGQRDLGDTTHFTIPYVRNGKPGALHGGLLSDGNVATSPTRSAIPSPK